MRENSLYFPLLRARIFACTRGAVKCCSCCVLLINVLLKSLRKLMMARAWHNGAFLKWAACDHSIVPSNRLVLPQTFSRICSCQSRRSAAWPAATAAVSPSACFRPASWLASLFARWLVDFSLVAWLAACRTGWSVNWLAGVSDSLCVLKAGWLNR